MANKFSDYVSNSDNSTYKYSNTNNLNEQNLQEMIDKYSSLDSTQLMQEFMRLSAQKKQNGTLDNSSIENIKNTIFPYLDEHQKQMFYKLMDDIK